MHTPGFDISDIPVVTRCHRYTSPDAMTGASVIAVDCARAALCNGKWAARPI